MSHWIDSLVIYVMAKYSLEIYPKIHLQSRKCKLIYRKQVTSCLGKEQEGNIE